MTTCTKVNKDLKDERDKVSFSVEEFTNWYHGGVDKVAEKRFFGMMALRKRCENFYNLLSLDDYFLLDPELTSSVDMSYLSHKEKYEEAIRRTTVMLKKIKKLESEGHSGKDIHK